MYFIYIIVTVEWIQAERPGFDCQQWEGVLFATEFRPALRPTQTPFTWASEVKRSEREANHSRSYSVMAW